MAITDQELLALNAKGFIPGPGETEETLLTRALAAKQSFQEKGSLPRAHWEWTNMHLKELFDFEPDSLVAFYSNKQLAPWQGAACWIEEDRTVHLQLREGFRKGQYLKMYAREETLAHEAIHAARAAFDEPENEEFFAFAASEKKWRRVLGPIIKKPWEAWALFASLLTNIFWQEASLVSFLLIAAGFYRLIRQHRRLSNAFKTVMGKCKEKKRARSALFRLTDLEIRKLSKGEWLEGDDSLRWRLLRLAYFR